MLIGLAGKKGSGKSTVGKFLEPHGFKRIAFAGPLKEIICKTFGIPLSILNDPVAKETYSFSLYLDKDNVTRLLTNAAPYQSIPYSMLPNILQNIPDTFITNPRQLMQIVGTEIFRNQVDKDYWLRAFENQILPNKNYVCEDIRFPNELDLVKNKLQGKVIVVERTGSHIFDPHPSEQLEITDYDYKLYNNRDLDTLKEDSEITLALIKGEYTWAEADRVKTKANGSIP